MGPLVNLSLLHNKDFWSGILLAAVGVAAVVIARDYPFGTALRLAPGYFPSVLGGGLALFGVYFVVKPLRGGARIEANCSLPAPPTSPLSLLLTPPLIAP